ncbi:hypothetical protein COBT_001362 [Conglomerata obtusa]
MRAEARAGKLSYELVLAFFLKEVPQNLARIVIRDTTAATWEKVYEIVERWEISQKQTNLQAEQECWHVHKENQMVCEDTISCFFCKKKDHVKKKCFKYKSRLSRKNFREVKEVSEQKDGMTEMVDKSMEDNFNEPNLFISHVFILILSFISQTDLRYM